MDQHTAGSISVFPVVRRNELVFSEIVDCVSVRNDVFCQLGQCLAFI